MKKYEDYLIGCLVLVIFFPIVAFLALIAMIQFPFQYLSGKKAYKQSLYYQDLHVRFRHNAETSPAYRFYNGFKARGLHIEFIRWEADGLEYFVYGDTLYLFPRFDSMQFDEEKAIWEVLYDGYQASFEQDYQKIVAEFGDPAEKRPIKLLVERAMLSVIDLRRDDIPECIHLTQSYETAFENDDAPSVRQVPMTAEELYEMMRETPDLCGDFALDGKDGICWDLYEKVRIAIGVNMRDCCIRVEKKRWGSITHWHPTAYEIYDEVCKMGVRGNVLVIRTSLFGESALYMGDEANCPYSPKQTSFLGKRYYLKAE